MTIWNMRKKSLYLASALLLAGCAPMVSQHGNLVQDYQLKEVVPGTHTRSDVLKLLGSPTTTGTFDDKTWYYIGQETEKRGILDPQTTKERIITVTFDDADVVQNVTDSDGSNGAEIPYSADATPTHGNDMTLMQQFLGNLGRFNPQDSGPIGAGN